MAFMRSFIPLASTALFLGVGNSVYELACHVLLINVWSEKVGNFIQILHMSYGVGSMLAPLLIRFFLLPIPKDAGDDKDAARNFYSPDDVQIKYPFVTTCALSIIVGFGFGYSYLKRAQNTKNPDSDPKKTGDSSSDHHQKVDDQPSNLKICIAVIWVAILAHLAFSMQLTLCSFAQAFGVKHSFNMKKKSAALLSSLFWAFYVISKLIFVILSMTIGQTEIVNLCYGLTAVSLALLLALASQFEICLWLAFGLLGLGYSPLFAVAYASLEKYFHVTGRQTSFIFLAGGIGESLHTTMVGTFMDDNPPFFLHYVGTLGTIFLIMVVALPYLCRFLFGDPDERKFEEQATKIRTTRLSSIALPPPGLFRGSLIDSSPPNIFPRDSTA
ncbi:sodium-dependent glucose transporter 1-like isoform X2 [Brevipalpus obovatus]